MIRITHGDIFKSYAEALVCPVNLKGVMGAGLALKFNREFPHYGESYRRACTNGTLHTRSVHVFTYDAEHNTKFIISFPTKTHWKFPSTLKLVELGLGYLTREISDRRIASLAIPALGCGLGGLPWETVREAIEKAFSTISEVDVELYAPFGRTLPLHHSKDK